MSTKVDKKLNPGLKKHLRRDILLRLYICAEARSCLRNFLEGSGNNETTTLEDCTLEENITGIMKSWFHSRFVKYE